MLHDLLELIVSADRWAISATSALRWEPLTAVLALVSAWWVKGPLLVAAAWLADVRGRRLVPLAALAATAAFLVASGLNALLKDLADRERPPLGMDLEALVSLPSSPSFPSGHAMTAFATASAIALLVPRLRAPVLALAALIAFSRVYLGVHYWIDVVVGAGLGLAIGILLARPLVPRCCAPRAAA